MTRKCQVEALATIQQTKVVLDTLAQIIRLEAPPPAAPQEQTPVNLEKIAQQDRDNPVNRNAAVAVKLAEEVLSLRDQLATRTQERDEAALGEVAWHGAYDQEQEANVKLRAECAALRAQFGNLARAITEKGFIVGDLGNGTFKIYKNDAKPAQLAGKEPQ